MIAKQEYPCPEVGARVQIGTINDMLNNIGAYDCLNESLGAKRKMLIGGIPASFSIGMGFLEGAQGIVERIDAYYGNIRNKFLQDNYKDLSIKSIYIRFDDPEINERADAYKLTTPMLVKQKSRYDLHVDIKFRQNFTTFSKWGESYTSVENIL